MIEPVRLPLEFRCNQIADLNDWGGELSPSGFHASCEGMSATLRGVQYPAQTAGIPALISTKSNAIY